jgi:hypothetical protein
MLSYVTFVHRIQQLTIWPGVKSRQPICSCWRYSLTTNKIDNSWNIYLCKYSTWCAHKLCLTSESSILKDGSFLGLPLYLCPCSKLVIKQMIIQDVPKGISTLASKMVNYPGISVDAVWNHINPKYKTTMIPNQLPWSVMIKGF